MKSLKEKALNISEREYHALPAWSYSKIARYARGGFQALNELDTPMEQTPEMRFGSLFDAVMTHTKEDVNAHYIISSSSPTPAKKAVLDYLVLQKGVPFEELDDASFQEAFDACNYQANQKFDTKVKGLQEGYEYYTTRLSGKDIVTPDEWEDAMTMSDNIKTDPYLSTIFGQDNGNKEYLYQIQFQAPIEVNGKTLPVKCMFDLLIVDHKEKTLQPVDLKTSYMPGHDWADHFVKMRYDIEAQVYVAVLQNVIKGTEYEEYKLLPYLFTDISRTDKVPVTYWYDPVAYPNLKFKDYEYKDWKTLLTEIVEYRETEAKVPSYIRIDGPNDLLQLLNGNR